MDKYEAEFTGLRREINGLRYRCENCSDILSKVQSSENVLSLILDMLGEMNRSLEAVHQAMSPACRCGRVHKSRKR